MKKIIFLLIFSALTVSCKKEAKADVYIDQSTGNVTDPADNSGVIAPALVPNNLPASEPVSQTMPQNGSSKTPSVNSQTQPQQATRSANANPPHGQPGHRCDIPVGQPLNSAPTQKIESQPQQKITQTTVPMPAQPLKIAPGMNPQHGQPGHRCDLAVGAPLNTPAPVKETNPQVVDAPNNPAPTGPKPAVNPPHGQPYHQCSIAVGAPLS